MTVTVQCSKWVDCGIRGGGCCAADHLDRPSHGSCIRGCRYYDGPLESRDMPTIDRAPIDFEKLTIAKVRSFIAAWKRLLAEGCVSREVRKRRKQVCMSCPANRIAQDGRSHYCSECGCGTRQPAILYVEGEPAEGTHEHPRLYMPDMKCPRKLISEHHGIGSWDAVGGRTKQFKLLMKATRSELKQFGKRSSHMIREIIYGTTKAKT